MSHMLSLPVAPALLSVLFLATSARLHPQAVNVEIDTTTGRT